MITKICNAEQIGLSSYEIDVQNKNYLLCLIGLVFRIERVDENIVYQ